MISSLMTRFRRAIFSFLLATSLAAAQGTPPASPQIDPGKTTQPDSNKLEIIKSEKANYPMQASEKSIQGEVWVRLNITETGEVQNVEVISGDPALTQAAADAAKKWRFKPFIRNGKAIKVTTKLPFDFTFQGTVTDIKVKDDKSASLSNTPQSGIPPNLLQVSSGVAAGLLIHKVNPVYPPEAKQARISGTVVLQGTISKEGRVEDLKVISGALMLTQAAVGAVQQWRYRPYLLMGVPVAVKTIITVNFNLSW